MTKPKRNKEPALSVEKRKSLQAEQREIVKKLAELRSDFLRRDAERKSR